MNDIQQILNENLLFDLLGQDVDLFEMANLPPQETGLPYIIWLGEVGGQHGPRIKVSNIKGTLREKIILL